ncbi:MAG: glycosyltransferase [SAR324 cluster bacterium]|nr:glycosyltransferase [SAR324 cluster bacterium]
MPLVSVILPTWNRASWLSASIDSVLTQTFRDFELIVVNDGSTDDTSRLLEQYGAEIKVIDLPENRGVSYARNRGLDQATGEWLAFLDSDDQWLPQKLEKQLRRYREQPQVKIHFTDEIWIRNGIRVNPMKKHQKHEGWIFIPGLSLCLMAPSAIMIHRDIFEACGNFDEQLPVCEDYDLWLRITARYPVALLNEKLMIRYGGHEDQLSCRSWGNDRYRVQSLKKILETVPLSAEYRQAAIEKLIEKSRILAQGFGRHGDPELSKYYAELATTFQNSGWRSDSFEQ